MDDFSYQVSSEFSRAIARYLREEYNISVCAFLTTKNLYTLLDLQAIGMETFIKDEQLRKLRMENFVQVGALKTCNTDSVFNEMARQWSNLDSGIIIIPLNDIRKILTEIGSNAPTDVLTDCVIVSFVNEDDAYVMVGDFISFSIN